MHPPDAQEVANPSELFARDPFEFDTADSETQARRFWSFRASNQAVGCLWNAHQSLGLCLRAAAEAAPGLWLEAGASSRGRGFQIDGKFSGMRLPACGLI